MSSMINTNITSLNAQNNLAKSQGALATSLQRLSSGLRINSAKDDSAGLAIASRMSAQISGMGQASRNANDAISMSQTAESAMGQVGDILQRMRDLSVQSANGSNSTDDRKTIQNEVDQLTSEIDRISGSTEFNGNKLLDGSSNNNNFQVGANANQTISFKIAEVSTQSMSLNSTSALGDLNSGRISVTAPAAGSAQLVINGTGITQAATDITATLKAVAINAQSGTTGVSATAYNSVQGTAGQTGISDATLTINGATIKTSSSMGELVDNINKQAGGVTASIGSNGGLSLTNDTGANIVVGGTTTGTGLTAGTSTGYLSLTSGDGSDIKLTGTNLALGGFNTSTGGGSITGSATTSAGTEATAALASANVNTTQAKGALLTTDDVKINGVAVGKSGASANEKAAAINAISGQTGVTATADTTVYLTTDFSAAGAFTINGTTVTSVAADDTASLVTKINAAGVAGVTASTDATTGRLKLNASSGTDIVLGNTPAFITGVSSDAAVAGTAVGATQFMAVRGTVSLAGADGASVRVEGSAASLTKVGLVAQGGNSETIGGKLDVSTQANAQSAIKRIDSAISFIATQRSTMGAVQNRFSSAISNLASSSENMTAARSRIQDADFATETASLTRGQILQQAGTAMLAQANSLPNGVMALLR